MNIDVEELLHDGMERFTAGVQAPAGLAHAASRLRRRRLAVRAAVACGTAAVTAAAVVAVAAEAGGGPVQTGPTVSRAHTAAYVISRVEKALAGQHLVFRGRTTTTTGGGWGPSVSWAYGPRHRFEELTASDCGHALPNGNCTYNGGSEPYLAQGTALIGGKLTSVYVTYFNRKWSVISEFIAPNACSTTGALEMGGPPPATSNWPAFIHATLACGAATVTGHTRIDGVDTLEITGSPVTVKLPPDQAKAYREKWLRNRWTLYVNPTTYLPVRLSGSESTYGGPAPSTYSTSVTDMQWLPPTAADIAQSLVTIPAGFQQVSSPADQ
jgi:hypothetical protein